MIFMFWLSILHLIDSDYHQALGCGTMFEEIHLSCSNGGWITVTRAYYGQYRQEVPCGEPCCPPNPGLDCTESVNISKINQYESLRD